MARFFTGTFFMTAQFNGDFPLLQGQVALVTGSTRGLGRGIAGRLARAGAGVALHDLDAAQSARFDEASGPEEVVAGIEALGVPCAAFFGDLTQSESAQRVVSQALAHFGRIDVLVNCAGGDIGVSGGKPVPNDCVEIPEEDLRVIIDRNLFSAMHVSRAVAPHMISRGSGSIINISSFAGMVPCADGSIYAVAKAAMLHWTRCLALQLRPHGVRVNSVSPGPTRTARFLATRPLTSDVLQDSGPLTRLGEADDIAKVCLFYASDLAAYVSGQNLAVNGGAG